MKTKLTVLLLLATSLVLLAGERTSLNMLHSIFTDIKVNNGSLILKTKSGGQRFLYSVNDSDQKLAEYDQTITLPSGFSKVEFKTRGYSLTLTQDAVDASRYTVCEIVDTRSAGGERQCTEMPLLITSEGVAVPKK